MNKYGVDNFIFEIIEEVPNKILNEREVYWIKKLNSIIPNGYNMTTGGEGTPGFSRTQSLEEREKRKEFNKKFYLEHPEVLKERSRFMKEKWKNDEEFRNKVQNGFKKFKEQNPNLF